MLSVRRSGTVLWTFRSLYITNIHIVRLLLTDWGSATASKHRGVWKQAQRELSCDNGRNGDEDTAGIPTADTPTSLQDNEGKTN